MPSTNPLLRTLARVRAEGRMALCGYFLVGYPTPETFYRLVRAAGALDVIEYGIPTHEPAMDGPVIAGAHAVVTEERGILAETAMALIGGLRHIPRPRFVMTYTEVGRALPGFLRLCVENDIHGVIAPDISYDEGRYVATIARALNLAVLMLLDARADAETIRQRVELGDMIYLKVSAGRTGDRVEIASRHDTLANAIEQIRALDNEIPIGVGIGLQHPDQIAAMAALGVDMAIVGTKVVEKSQIGNGALVDYLESLRASTYYREVKS